MAITTMFRGIEYRSRLEARWAAFFEIIGWQFTYEPLDGDGYIPDFLIHGDAPFLVEVKPAFTEEEYRAPISKIEAGLRSHWEGDVLIVGALSLAAFDDGTDHPVAGILGEPCGPIDIPTDWLWATGHWFTCGRCGRIGVFHSILSYRGRPCGHQDGDHYLDWISAGQFHRSWNVAANQVKWRPSAARLVISK